MKGLPSKCIVLEVVCHRTGIVLFAGVCVPFYNPESLQTGAVRLKPRVGQNIAVHASPTARNYFLVLISTFSVHEPSFVSSFFSDRII